jgi:hypothetical protein
MREKTPEQAKEDKRLTSWELLKSKIDALSHIRNIYRMMEGQRYKTFQDYRLKSSIKFI